MKLEVERVYCVTHSMLLYICCAQDSYRVVRSRQIDANRDNGVIELHFEHTIQEAMDIYIIFSKASRGFGELCSPFHLDCAHDAGLQHSVDADLTRRAIGAVLLNALRANNLRQNTSLMVVQN